MDSGGQNLWNLIDIHAMSKFFFKMGKPPYERRFGDPVSGPMIHPCGTKVEHLPISTEDQARLLEFGKRVLSRHLYGLRSKCQEKLERKPSLSQTLRN